MQKTKSKRANPHVRKPGLRVLTPRDQAIMQYIWRWKIASTLSIHTAINETLSPYSTYKTLDRLERFGFLEGRHHLTADFHVWSLSREGFEAIMGELGELKEEGYQSENHPHDRLVQAFQLGEWSIHRFPSVTFFTEQDLRRRPVEDYPVWIPQSAEHRPDGYTRITNDEKNWTLAYEVELSAKGVQRYEQALRFYSASRQITRVLWLVGSKSIRDTILRAKDCIRDDSTNYHVFVDLKEYLEKGWDADVYNERSVKLFTLREKYQRTCGEPLSELIGNLRGRLRVHDHLQKRKVIGKTRTSRVQHLLGMSDCI
jgi:hypothetical protein